MTKHGKEILGIAFQQFAITPSAKKKLIEDYLMCVEESLMAVNMVADYSFAINTCTLEEVRMRHNYVLNVCGMTINPTNQNQIQRNGLNGK